MLTMSDAVAAGVGAEVPGIHAADRNAPAVLRPRPACWRSAYQRRCSVASLGRLWVPQAHEPKVEIVRSTSSLAWPSARASMYPRSVLLKVRTRILTGASVCSLLLRLKYTPVSVRSFGVARNVAPSSGPHRARAAPRGVGVLLSKAFGELIASFLRFLKQWIRVSKR